MQSIPFKNRSYRLLKFFQLLALLKFFNQKNRLNCEAIQSIRLKEIKKSGIIFHTFYDSKKKKKKLYFITILADVFK
jgi:uncharacterized radical SAM superfamily Fe-S cluster-containing enzyme